MPKKDNAIKSTYLLIAFVSLLIAWVLIRTTIVLFSPQLSFDAGFAVHMVITTIMVVSTLTAAVKLLLSLWKNETPFNMKNVRYLKLIAILLLVREPYAYIASMVYQNLYPVMHPNGDIHIVNYTLNTAVLAAGLVVYCVSLVFRHGITLQQQVDETL